MGDQSHERPEDGLRKKEPSATRWLPIFVTVLDPLRFKFILKVGFFSTNELMWWGRFKWWLAK